MLTARGAPRRAQAGTTMMEVLVSIIIVVLGLLGLAGLQSQAALSEMEAFQRAQAVVLLQDMVDRINANRRQSIEYVTAGVGTGEDVEDCSGAATVAARDLCEWSNALLGAAEASAGLSVGAMVGARGCVTAISATMPRQFMVSVVWQGLRPTAEPQITACGQGEYGANGLRRAITSTIVIGCLQNDPASGACIGGI